MLSINITYYIIGVNYQSIPVNCPFSTRVRTYQRDGNI